ncbi:MULTISPECIES: hypothetical protein [unclassified Streptomyces]|uniref:hypothetical protein n=1 Tax=unclassified Streptomyces TaxID=2593676 RepID=UPI0033A44951
MPPLDRHLFAPGAPTRHADRFACQEAGTGTYLLARRGGEPVGYGQVRRDGCAVPLCARLGYAPVTAYTDRWSRTDRDGRVHGEADACTFLVRELSAR